MHVVAEFHSTFLHWRTASPRFMEINEWVCLICIEGRPSLMKIKTGFYIKKSFWQLLWGDGYKEKVLKIWKEKFHKIAVKCYCRPPSFYPFKVVFLMLSDLIYSRYSFLCVRFLCWTTCDFLFSAKWNIVTAHFVDIDQLSVIIIQYQPAQHRQVVLTRLYVNVVWILYPKIKLTMNLYRLLHQYPLCVIRLYYQHLPLVLVKHYSSQYFLTMNSLFNSQYPFIPFIYSCARQLYLNIEYSWQVLDSSIPEEIWANRYFRFFSNKWKIPPKHC